MKVNFAGHEFNVTETPRFRRNRIHFRIHWTGQDFRPAMLIPRAEDLILPGYGTFSVLLDRQDAAVLHADGHYECELVFLRAVDPPQIHAP